MADEELAPTGVLPRMGHGQRSGPMAMGIQMGFALDLIARSASAGPGVSRIAGEGIAALDHEIGDDPMEAGSVVELGVGQFLEVRHGCGDFGIEELCGDGTTTGFNDRRLHGNLDGESHEDEKKSTLLRTMARWPPHSRALRA